MKWTFEREKLTKQRWRMGNMRYVLACCFPPIMHLCYIATTEARWLWLLPRAANPRSHGTLDRGDLIALLWRRAHWFVGPRGVYDAAVRTTWWKTGRERVDPSRLSHTGEHLSLTIRQHYRSSYTKDRISVISDSMLSVRLPADGQVEANMYYIFQIYQGWAGSSLRMWRTGAGEEKIWLVWIFQESTSDKIFYQTQVRSWFALSVTLSVNNVIET